MTWKYNAKTWEKIAEFVTPGAEMKKEKYGPFH